MADVKQIEVNGVTYDICDAVARQDIASLQDSVGYVTYDIPNNTERTPFLLPTRFLYNNSIFIGARIVSKYGSVIDTFYNGNSIGDYFGSITYTAEYPNHFFYKPNVAGNASRVVFCFIKIAT